MFEAQIEELNKKTAEEVQTKPSEKRTYRIDEIQDILDISRSSAYRLVKRNLFRVVRVGGAIRISKKSFDDWLDSQL